MTHVLLSLVSATVLAQEGVTGEVSGYLEHRSTLVFGLSADLTTLPLTVVDFTAIGFNPEDVYGMTNHVRPTAKLHFGERATLSLTADAHTYHYFNERRQDALEDFVSVERLTLFVTADALDLTLGKQVLNWGHGLLLNPTAPNNERPPQDLRAELEGLWAVKLLFPPTDSQNVTLAVAVHEDTPDDPIAVGRWDANFGTVSTAATVTWRDEDPERLAFGLEVKGDIEDGPSLWAETSTSVRLDEGEAPVFEVEAGLDYSFDVLNGLYLAAEGIWHGSGTDGGYLQSAVGGGRRSTLLGQIYALLLVRQTFDAYWEAQLLSLVNAGDPSGTVSAQVTWLPIGSLELTLGGNLSWGADDDSEYSLAVPEAIALGGNLIPTPDTLRGLRLVPKGSVYLWARYYF